MPDQTSVIQELKNILAGNPSKLDFRNEIQKALYLVNKQLAQVYLNPNSPDYIGNKPKHDYQLTFDKVKNLFSDLDRKDIENGDMPQETICAYLLLVFNKKI